MKYKKKGKKIDELQDMTPEYLYECSLGSPFTAPLQFTTQDYYIKNNNID